MDKEKILRQLGLVIKAEREEEEKQALIKDYPMAMYYGIRTDAYEELWGRIKRGEYD